MKQVLPGERCELFYRTDGQCSLLRSLNFLDHKVSHQCKSNMYVYNLAKSASDCFAHWHKATSIDYFVRYSVRYI